MEEDLHWTRETLSVAFVVNIANSMPARFAVVPTDRSVPIVINTSVCPSAAMPTKDICLMMMPMLYAVRKFGERKLSTAPNTMMNSSMNSAVALELAEIFLSAARPPALPSVFCITLGMLLSENGQFKAMLRIVSDAISFVSTMPF